MRRRFVAHGHTLVEFLIATALGLLVTAGAVSLYTTQRQAFERASDDLRIREAGLTALMLIGQQLQMAGFVPADVVGYNRPPPLFGCSGGRPTGADDSLGCTTLNTGSDGIAIRYVGDIVSTWPSSSGQVTDCVGQAVKSADAALGDQGAPVVNRYFATLSGSTGEPELYCEGNGNPGAAQPLVDGIERVRLRYWLEGIPDALNASAVSAEQWTQVVAVDLCVLVRGAAQRQRSRYTDCDGVSTLSADLRTRQAFARRVAVRGNRAEVSL
ncbi:PilW family protein [Paraburkholderia sp. MMS20-SJTR3]|uniref:PilW family protein n=1 Tax=Paraburkholderia sejongensis TaxID=2886946 RepID=A0ABS8JPQ9_9BURK|nr:PilW family protein [Paraburkholderia sp. MMS20-SJTR3]MCC8391883.1 PilW family protein [Paraburkholderia sp. MMS20-SJTR3]